MLLTSSITEKSGIGISGGGIEGVVYDNEDGFWSNWISATLSSKTRFNKLYIHRRKILKKKTFKREIYNKLARVPGIARHARVFIALYCHASQCDQELLTPPRPV